MFKEIRIRAFFRWLWFCSWRGCSFDEAWPLEVGPVLQDEEHNYYSGIDEDLGEVLGTFQQCSRCYKVVKV